MQDERGSTDFAVISGVCVCLCYGDYGRRGGSVGPYLVIRGVEGGYYSFFCALCVDLRKSATRLLLFLILVVTTFVWFRITERKDR